MAMGSQPLPSLTDAEYQSYDAVADIDHIERVVESEVGDNVTLPRRHVLYLIRMVRIQENQLATSCAQAARLCADCLSTFCEAEDALDSVGMTEAPTPH